MILSKLLKIFHPLSFSSLIHKQIHFLHHFGTINNIFAIARFQNGLPDFSESPIKSSFLMIIQ